MAELLLELFSEEIPARMQAEAVDQFRKTLLGLANECGFGEAVGLKDIETLVTPRRLTGVVRNLPDSQPDIDEEKRGPRRDAPDGAVEGFARSVGVPRRALKTAKHGKAEYYVARIRRKGRPTADLLKEKLPDLIYGFSWPKSMRWGAGQMRWVRPLRRVLCLFDGQAISVKLEDGVPCGDTTVGHRFLAPKSFRVKNFSDYRARLFKAKVMLDSEQRKRVIREGAVKAAAAEGLTLKADDALVTENAGMVEWPVVLMGRFDKAFMELPPEVLMGAMRAQQKYFALLNPDGTLATRFVMVANMEARDGGKRIVAGNECVLRARLADAKFFWEQDRKRKLVDRVGALSGVIFHARLGSVGDKVQRLRKLAEAFARDIPGADPGQARRAALLCKADLTSEMVGEFPELQGVMGRYYALDGGEDAEVADAIAEHYAPQGPADRCPSRPVSVALALADKIDTLVGLFAVGGRPTGSKDPFALRRAALGAIRLIVENELRLPLLPAFKKADALYREVGAYRAEFTSDDLIAFFADRLKAHLRGQGVRHDLIGAVFAKGHEFDLVRILAKVTALEKFLDSDDGANLLTAYKRAANILRIEEGKDGASYDAVPQEDLLKKPEERALYASIAVAAPLADEALEKEDFEEAMAALAGLRQPVDGFFDRVTVNCEDAGLRRNRLHLLSRIRSALDRMADFSKIEG